MDERIATRIRPTPLGHDEKIRISRALQVFALDEIARQAPPRRDELVFHGGTGVSLVHGSPRWSEDLDFMATPEAIGRLGERHGAVERALRLKASVLTPGARLDLQDKTGTVSRRHEHGEVARWLIRWEHPAMLGAVRIKLEFYACPADRLGAYPSQAAWPAAREAQALHALPAATLVSVFGDKIVAMASRDALKYRDLHDLGWLSPRLAAAGTTEEDRLEALRASMGIYGKTPSDIAAGLARPTVSEGILDREAWEDDMRRWFAGPEYETLADRRELDRLHAAFRTEFAIGCDLVGRLCEAEVRAEGPEW
ncbi:nucleotidyl transferase AbiEii/AbiGii toxin family protein [Cereibacter sphaeroides]|uniref:nucleotidyl transferase AbiEii/AbiGii toxin family protein n=1 Tax=Cereibacter sphaeroides TaxID=1063 RepID=UPI001F3C00F0|nr:nucleotidyl transferase AbiEii/AbiGii toxin family protein [Cereibacter sphaeroides]MCE6959326.1 nucleotidyl transferase AbiEii/AbiGii toxin family protein [Cereibacter sphaeroides]MCE6972918.1 nucleotidyl transferase AbiEii/AbiGii toxin family protein [Cereibacter sphaeroides]